MKLFPELIRVLTQCGVLVFLVFTIGCAAATTADEDPPEEDPMFQCSLTLSVGGDTAVGAILFNVDYGGLDIEFDSDSDGDVDCPSDAFDGGFVTYTDRIDQAGLFTVGGISAAGVDVPFELGPCDFMTEDDTIEPDDFTITVVDASESGEDIIPIDPFPPVTITDIDCEEIET